MLSHGVSITRRYIAMGLPNIYQCAPLFRSYLTGVKANFFTVGVDARVNYNNCSASNIPEYRVDSIATWAQEAGKSTGLITTTTVTNASPAGVYANVANRMWESDKDVKDSNNDPAQCQDIAKQLVFGKTGSKLDVIFGGGRTKFRTNKQIDRSNIRGERLDGVDLVSKWKSLHPNSRYIETVDELRSLESNPPNKVLGLFASGHMPYYLDRNAKEEPTLPEMTEAAIKLLQRNEKGFFLFVEGGRIDHGHHDTKAAKALSETLQMDQAIERALALTNAKDTLIVVTADHAHTMTIGGWPVRGQDILGLNSVKSDIGMLIHHSLDTYANMRSCIYSS